MKKILLFFTLFFSFWTGLNQSNAEMIDYMSGSTRFSYGYQMLTSASGTTNFVYTGGINLDTSKKLYVKSIDCMFRNYRTSVSPLEYEITLSPYPSFTQNYFKSYERLGTGTAVYKKYEVNQIIFGNILYFQNRLFFDSGSTSNAFLSTCYINGTYFSDYIPLSSSPSSMYKENTNSGSYMSLMYQDNYGNYYFNKDYSLWQEFFFYAIIILIVGIYLFFKFIRFILDIFFK